MKFATFSVAGAPNRGIIEGDTVLILGDVRREAKAVFILSEAGAPARWLGYDTLCALAIAQGDAPQPARAHVPRYPRPPALSCLR